jgi:Zn-dependent M28 family amino/carboxypeptidase
VGLLGSTAYVETHRDELDHVDFMLNLDCAGSVGSKAMRLHAWPAMKAHAQRVLDQIEGVGLADWFSYRSDHFPFWSSGIPTAYGFGGAGNPLGRYQHTAADTADKIQRQGIQMDALLTARMLLRVSRDH